MTAPANLPPQPPATAWHALTGAAVLEQLKAPAAGLGTAEAVRRLATQGPNEIKEGRRISPFAILLSQFKSLIIWILIFASLVSGLLGEMTDAIAIIAIVILNAIIGFYQEFSAEKSIAALRKMTAPNATVQRDGQVQTIPAAGIVPGDLLVLEAGDLVAADARLLEAASLKCIESALTGESDAVTKHPVALPAGEVPLGDRANMLFMGTSVAAGAGRAVVVATGMQTELGRIAGLIADSGAEASTPLQQKLDAFGRLLVWVTLGIVALLFVLGLLRGTGGMEMFMTSVSLAVAAVPEGLPAVVTVALALGVLRMSRRRTLVRKLPAVETLGSTTVICTDKTGTLTVGEMTVRALYVAGVKFDVSGEGYGPDGEIRCAGNLPNPQQTSALQNLSTVLLGCNNAHLVQENGTWKVVGDPTEGALLVAAGKAGGNREKVEQDLPKQHAFPFDSDRKRSSVIRRMPDGKLRAFVNGAPDVLLQRCSHVYAEAGIRPLTAQDRQAIEAQNTAMAGLALRVLGSAWRDLDALPADLNADSVERDLVFIGLTGMYDPPRPEAKIAVAKCHTAGIQVVMITGDHPQTATAIARDLGIAAPDSVVLTGAELDAIADAELQQRAPQIAVYARVTAEHKLRIIRAWRANDAVVAMTGDGVNDAPAIKGADIGIAMGKSGTEVTKQASDMIITDDNFASIVAAIEQGRGIYDNIRKTLQYLLAGNTGEVLLMTVCVVAGLPAPLLPIHLLWINLVTDGLPALCLATDPIDPDVMNRRPRRKSDLITNRRFLTTTIFTGFLTAGISFAVFYYMLQTTNLETARTYAFSVLVFEELLRSFSSRSSTRPLWQVAFFANYYLVLVVMASMALQLWIPHSDMLGRFLKTSPLSLNACLLGIAIGAIPLLVLETVKAVQYFRRKSRSPVMPAH